MRFQAKLVFSTDGETEKAANEVESADLNLLYKISGKNKFQIWDHFSKIRTYSMNYKFKLSTKIINFDKRFKIEFLDRKISEYS